VRTPKAINGYGRARHSCARRWRLAPRRAEDCLPTHFARSAGLSERFRSWSAMPSSHGFSAKIFKDRLWMFTTRLTQRWEQRYTDSGCKTAPTRSPTYGPWLVGLGAARLGHRKRVAQSRLMRFSMQEVMRLLEQCLSSSCSCRSLVSHFIRDSKNSRAHVGLPYFLRVRRLGGWHNYFSLWR